MILCVGLSGNCPVFFCFPCVCSSKYLVPSYKVDRVVNSLACNVRVLLWALTNSTGMALFPPSISSRTMTAYTSSSAVMRSSVLVVFWHID